MQGWLEDSRPRRADRGAAVRGRRRLGPDRHRHRPRRRAGRASTSRCSAPMADAVDIPVIAAGGLASVDRHRAPARAAGRADRRRGAGPRALRRRDPSGRGAGGGGVTMLKVRVIPCLDVKDGRVVKGVQFVSLRDAGDPVEQASGLRRGRRRRADVPRHHRQPRGPRRHPRRGRPHRRRLLHAGRRRRRHPHGRGRARACCAPAPTRSRSTPPRSRTPT